MANTKIKWFRNTNKNAPQLTNNWGDLIKLFDACLINGFNELAISQASVTGLTSESSDYITFTYLEAHGYLQYQILEVSGSDIESVNGVHRILEVSKDGLSLTFKIDTSITDVGSLLNIKTKLASAGWEKLHADVDKGIYRGTAKEGKNCCFFVDNSQHTLYVTNWSKFARVGYAEDFESMEKPLGISVPSNWDNFIPYQSGTNINWGGFSMFYATPNNPEYGTRISNAPSAGNREWTLIADDSYFYLINATTPSSNGYYLGHFFGQYDPLIDGWEHNVAISANAWSTMNQTTNFTPSTEVGGLCSISRPFYTGVVYTNSGDNHQLYSRSLYDVNRSGGSNWTASSGPTHLFSVYIRDSNPVILGKFRNMYWLAQNFPFSNKQVFTQGTNLYMGHNIMSEGSNCQVAFKIGEL